MDEKEKKRIESNARVSALFDIRDFIDKKLHDLVYPKLCNDDKTLEEVDERYRKREEEKVGRTLPGLLHSGKMVWCRNGSVCAEATPCLELYCKHKRGKEDIVFGVSRCGQYQITKKSKDWAHAELVCEPCSVEPYKGW